MTPLRVLCLARNYPNNVLPRLGLWTERFVRACEGAANVAVIAPVPYWPPLPGPSAYTRFRRVEPRERHGRTEVLHPRFLTGPGYWLHDFEAWPYYASVVRTADRVRHSFPFDLIHAHFVYPDGWAAAKLALRYRVPLIITEQANWSPWLDVHPVVRRRALWAVERSTFVVAVSRALGGTIATFIGPSAKLRVIPNAVDGSVFTLPTASTRPQPNRVLFVGVIRHVKGVDVLLRALRVLLDRGRDVRLAIVSDSFYESYRRDYERLRRLAADLRLDAAVDFLGGMPPEAVAREMQASAVVALPSRRETFGAVLAEALACGTPVVATSCGGTEDIVNASVGLLVPPEDPEALANGIGRVLDRGTSYDPAGLRAYALERFSLESVGSRLLDLYREAVHREPGRQGDAQRTAQATRLGENVAP